MKRFPDRVSLWFAPLAVALLIAPANGAELSDLPASVQSKVLLWFEAGTGVATSGSSVTTWADISDDSTAPSGSDISQGSAALRPLLIGSSPSVNNRPVVRFDGSNDVLTTTTAGLLESLSSFEAFIVADVSGGGSTPRLAAQEGPAAGVDRSYEFGLNSTATRIRSVMDFDSPAALVDITEPVSSLGAFRLYGHRHDGDALFIDVDGLNVVSGGSGLGVTTDAPVDQLFGIGGSPAGGFNAAFDLAEFIIFDESLTAEERNLVGGLLEDKFGLDTLFQTPIVPLAPEPTTVVLWALGLSLLVGRYWLRRRRLHS